MHRIALRLSLGFGLAASLALSANTLAAPCSDPPADNDVDAFCGVDAPEDIVLFDDQFLLLSSMAPAKHLFGFSLASETVAAVETSLDPVVAAENWGDTDCSVPTQILSHGLDLSRRASGQWQLLVVNHEGRESIEFFEVTGGGEAAPRLQWRGCVMAAENAQFNDVAGLADGGFIATDPITASMQLPRMLLGSVGMDTGRAYRWRPQSGYSAIPHTDGAYPNGITLSADGQSFYLNLYLDGEVREHDLETGEVLKRVAVSKPDNSTLSDSGTLLVASHDASLFALLRAIVSEAGERNRIAFEIVELDLQSFEPSVRYRSEGEELGGGTVALPVGNDLYIGAFKGDRFIRVR
ncbi:SMP-30/gluconolactonase/LRE family protein [Congregibacter variabilis]|uniref:SMP-30/gluconolactonase/LRE family protein n=1 Tax=Congregibacter variabilis TaxID=3081200 RepID=A0ABZ0HZ90_9GAMM|nr:SMP-30/gluconolactonase/LRE family protein [Congregibacter sp. IMCC43200]